MRLEVFLLFSVLLTFTNPCSATRTLYEAVHTALCHNAAFPVPSEELLKKIQTCSDDYEAKILENLHELAAGLMGDLLTFLQKDALSLKEIRTKINTDGYETSSDQRRVADTFCFYHLSRWSFDKIQSTFANSGDTSEPNFRHLSATTIKLFREAEPLFQQYVQDCNAPDAIGKILCTVIRSFYDFKKSGVLPNELYKDPWYLAAQASDGFWSTILYSVMLPHTTQFDPERMKDFIHSVTTQFDVCIDSFDATCGKYLREDIKAQFRANCFEYLLRGVYARYNTPSPERNTLINAIFEYAGTTFNGS